MTTSADAPSPIESLDDASQLRHHRALTVCRNNHARTMATATADVARAAMVRRRADRLERLSIHPSVRRARCSGGRAGRLSDTSTAETRRNLARVQPAL